MCVERFSILNRLMPTAVHSMHLYEVRPRKDKRGVDLISDVLPFGRLWYGGPSAVSNAIGYAEHRSRSRDDRRLHTHSLLRRCRHSQHQ